MRLNCSLLELAESLISLGLVPLAVAPKSTKYSFCSGKNPSYITADGVPKTIKHSQYQTTPPTKETLEQWFSYTDGIGVLCSDTIVCIDIDAKHFSSVTDCEEFVERWIDDHNLRNGWIERSRSGGYHIFIKLIEPKTFTNFQFKTFNQHCGEVIGRGRFVVLAPTEGYRLISKHRNLIEIDSLESIGILPSSKPTEPNTPMTVACKITDSGVTTITQKFILESVSNTVKRLLDGLEEIKGDRSTTITKVAKELYGWENHFKLNGVTPIEDVDSLIERFAYRIGYPIEKLQRTLKSIDRISCRPAIDVYGVWEPPYETVEANVEAFIKTNSERFRYNVLTQQLEFDGQTSKSRSAVINIREYMTSVATDKRKVSISLRDMEDLLLSYAVDNRAYNPIAEYLRSLPTVGEDLISPLAERMGLNENERMLLTKWLIQSYHRPLNSGCDAPYMLILYGAQGCGKTSTLRILSKGWIVSLNNRNSNGKDGVMLLHSGWFINNDELAALSKSDIEGLKAEITETTDTYRKPYSATTVSLKRFSVFCGTTNNPHILKDDSGNRRFFVLNFRHTFTEADRQWLEANVDRLWGYVKHLSESGMDYHLTTDEMESLTKMQQSYQLRSHRDDVLLGCILWFAKSYPHLPLSSATIAQFMKEHRENVSAQWVGRKLTAMGFETKRQKVGRTMVRAIANLDHIYSFEDITEYKCLYTEDRSLYGANIGGNQPNTEDDQTNTEHSQSVLPF